MAGDFEWNSALPVATQTERAGASILLRLGATTDAKQCLTTDFLQKSDSGYLQAEPVAAAVGAYTMILRGAAGGLGCGLSFQSSLSGGGALTEMARITADGEASWNAAAANQDAGLRFYVTRDGTLTERVRLNTDGAWRPVADNSQNIGLASFRWATIYAGTGSINTSDARLKRDVGDIPEAWVDAWAKVRWVRFKFVDRVRWHTGLIAQEVHAAFAAHGVDAFEIGLCGFDAWEEEVERVSEEITRTRTVSQTAFEQIGVNEQGEAIFRSVTIETEETYTEVVDTGRTRVVKPAGDVWSLRYDECQAMEAAWQRREHMLKDQTIGEMMRRIEALEARS